MATEPKKPATSGRTARKTSKPATVGMAAKGADLKAVEARITALESALRSEIKAAQDSQAQTKTALESRIAAVEKRASPTQTVTLPEGVPAGIRQGIDRAADLVRHNPITALILIIAFLLVAIFS